MLKYILFDLDGTITEPSLGITNSAKYALEKLGIKVNNNQDLLFFIGPPLMETFKEYYGFDDNMATLAVEKYREHYKDIGMMQCELYPSIEKLLIELKNMGYTLAIATCKPKIFAVPILKHFNLDKYFTYIAGASIDGNISLKEEVIQDALNNLNVTNNQEVIMIGDRKHDVIGAKKHNIDCIGVLYGYGSKQEFIDCNCKYIVNDVLDILELIKKVEQ